MNEITLNDQVVSLLKQFETRQLRESAFGAGDTEPDWVWQNYVARAMGLRTGKCSLPQNADDWELYSDMPGVDAAAVRLSEALFELTDGLKKLLAVDPPGVLQTLRDRLWRLDL